jgi:hypothetical protein
MKFVRVWIRVLGLPELLYCSRPKLEILLEEGEKNNNVM